MNEEAINRLITLLETNSGVIIDESARWHTIRSITWIIVGVGALIIAWKYPWQSDDHDIPLVIGRIILVVLGTLAVAVNVPDLFAPQGISIHQLIKDLTR